MKSSKIFNNISSKLRSQIPKLKPGESVVFKMLNGVPNPEPDEKERSKDPILYPKVQLLTRYRLFDPYQYESKDEKGNVTYEGAYVDCGCVDSWKGDEPIAFRCFVTGIQSGIPSPSRFQGKFELKGGNVADEELYEIYWLSPQRKGSPCADSSVEVIFEIQDAKSETKSMMTKYDTLLKAIEISKAIKPSKAREVMSALNQPTYQDDEILLAKVKEFASTKPKEFIDTYESDETPIKATIKSAMDANVLDYNLDTGEVKLGEASLMILKAESFDAFVPEFAKWVSTAVNGPDVLNNIKNRLAKKEVKVK